MNSSWNATSHIINIAPQLYLGQGKGKLPLSGRLLGIACLLTRLQQGSDFTASARYGEL